MERVLSKDGVNAATASIAKETEPAAQKQLEEMAVS
jgi:hypothetical protein